MNFEPCRRIASTTSRTTTWRTRHFDSPWSISRMSNSTEFQCSTRSAIPNFFTSPQIAVANSPLIQTKPKKPKEPSTNYSGFKTTSSPSNTAEKLPTFQNHECTRMDTDRNFILCALGAFVRVQEYLDKWLLRRDLTQTSRNLFSNHDYVEGYHW